MGINSGFKGLIVFAFHGLSDACCEIYTS